MYNMHTQNSLTVTTATGHQQYIKVWPNMHLVLLLEETTERLMYWCCLLKSYSATMTVEVYNQWSSILTPQGHCKVTHRCLHGTAPEYLSVKNEVYSSNTTDKMRHYIRGVKLLPASRRHYKIGLPAKGLKCYLSILGQKSKQNMKIWSENVSGTTHTCYIYN